MTLLCEVNNAWKMKGIKLPQIDQIAWSFKWGLIIFELFCRNMWMDVRHTSYGPLAGLQFQQPKNMPTGESEISQSNLTNPRRVTQL